MALTESIRISTSRADGLESPGGSTMTMDVYRIASRTGQHALVRPVIKVKVEEKPTLRSCEVGDSPR